MKIQVGETYKVHFSTCSKKDADKTWTLVVIRADKGYDEIRVFTNKVIEVDKGDEVKIIEIETVTLGTESYEDKKGNEQYKKVVTLNGMFKVV